MRKIIWMALIVLMMAACRPAAPTAVPATSAPDVTAAPTDIPEPTATGTLSPEGDPDAPPTYTYSGISVESFDNYGTKVTLAFMGRNPADQTASLTTEALVNGRRNPVSQLLVMNYTGSGVNTAEMGLGDQAQGQFSILVTPQQAYVTQNVNTASEACVSLPAASATPLIASLTSFDDLIGTALPEMGRVEPNEVIAGMESRHYHLDNLVNDKFSGGTVDIWVARDTGVVTRLVINGSGTFPTLGTGTLNASYELTSTQQSVDFSPPADCAALEQ